MENAIIIDGIKHVLVPTDPNTKNNNDCKICSLKERCDGFCDPLCYVFFNAPNSHFEIKE